MKMETNPLFARIFAPKVSDQSPLTRADLDAYFKANPINSMPAQGVNPVQFINPMYTRAPSMDNSLQPMAQLQAFRQTGQMPQMQSSFQPFQPPATPMTPVSPNLGNIATSTQGGK